MEIREKIILKDTLMGEISNRLNSSKLTTDLADIPYAGFDMSKTHSQDNEPITKHNENILKLFEDYLPKGIEKHFDCWKGTCFFAKDKNYNENIEEFGGWGSKEIIKWLILNSKNFVEMWEKENFFGKQKYEEEDYLEEDYEENIARIITKEMRYETLKRQKWKCNICGERLKYNSHSDWEGKIAHIDHIYPYSKRENYPRGKENINELSNLQALCPDCNFKKSDKKIG
jgi:hypothetical protein